MCASKCLETGSGVIRSSRRQPDRGALFMATTCRTCGQANADGTEYCVRCGTRMPDPSSTQLVGTGAPAAGGVPLGAPRGMGSGRHLGTPHASASDLGRHPAAARAGPGRVEHRPRHRGRLSGGHGAAMGQPAARVPPGHRRRLRARRRSRWIIGATRGRGHRRHHRGRAGRHGRQEARARRSTASRSRAPPTPSPRTRQALRDAKSAEISGNVRSSGTAVRFDVMLSGNNSKGTLTISGNDVQLIKIGQSVFIKGDQDFLKKYAGGNTAVLDKLNGKWLKTDSTSDFDLFTLDGFAGQLKGGTGSNAVNPTVTQATAERPAGGRHHAERRLEARHRQHRQPQSRCCWTRRAATAARSRSPTTTSRSPSPRRPTSRARSSPRQRRQPAAATSTSPAPTPAPATAQHRWRHPHPDGRHTPTR